MLSMANHSHYVHYHHPIPLNKVTRLTSLLARLLAGGPLASIGGPDIVAPGPIRQVGGS